jgi:ClpP class serine protease
MTAPEQPVRVWSQHLANVARAAFWLLLVVIILMQLGGSRGVENRRAAVLGQFERERNSRVIALIHRQESGSLLGVPVMGSISIDDSEAVLRAIRLTPEDQPIDIILHTPGGTVLAAEQIAKALVERKGKVTVFVPHYAMSGGTLIALAADEIVMDANAVLGPVDPQIDDVPAASIVQAVQIKGPQHVSDDTLILADIAQKARMQVVSFVAQVLLKHMPKKQAVRVATVLSEGRWTHDFPITVQAARSLGLKVSTSMPRTVYDLMDLYPQTGGMKPSVWYVPLRRTAAPAVSPAQPAPTPGPAAARPDADHATR